MRKSLNLPSSDIDSSKLQQEKKKFMNNRLKDLRGFLIVSNLSNMVFQAGALLKPIGERHFYMNLYYMINSIVMVTLQAMSFKQDKYLCLVLLNSALFMIRTSTRIIDIEQTSKHLGYDYWVALNVV